jgi:hypothetical protein
LVIRRHVIAALAIGVEAGDDAAAREALGQADWVLRGAAQRRLQRALIDAMLLTGEGYTGEDPEGMRHVQRVAALDVAGRNDIDVRDRKAVAEKFSRLPTAPPSRAPIATAMVAAGLLVTVLAFIWLVLAVRTPTRATRPPMPLPGGAFFHGGTPATDAELATFLESELTQLVIDTDADRMGSSAAAATRARRAKELRDAPLVTSRGPGLANAWRALIDALDRWVDVSTRDAAFKPAIRELGRRAQDVSEQFAALGLGFYISAEVMVHGTTARAALFSYRVEDVAFVRSGGEARRVLSLRRLDRLNLDLTLLGRQNDELGDPVVLLDQIDEFAMDRVMPVLLGETYRLGDGDWRRSSRAGRVLASDAADAIDRELRAALGDTFYDLDARARRIKQLVAATVRRHEARHAIDHDRARPLRYPKALEKLLGKRDGSTLRAELELAAYVSQIANDPALPQWTLWNLASHAFGSRWGGAEGYDAVVVIEGLARQLGSYPSRPLVVGGRLDRDALATLARPIAAQSSEKLRAAARALWTELYGEPLVPIVDVLAAN